MENKKVTQVKKTKKIFKKKQDPKEHVDGLKRINNFLYYQIKAID